MTTPACATSDPAHLAAPVLGQSSLLHRLTHRIRRSLSLQEILDATVAEVQQFLALDRVKIYRFHSDGSGQVLAECLSPQQPLPPLLGLNFPADDIPPQARQLFIEARVRNYVDVKAGLIGQSRLCDPETGDPLAADWAFRPLDPCHREYLTLMGVQAGISAPIFHQDQLWGLLVAHHAEPKELPLKQLQEVQLVVDQLSVAIEQASHLSEAQAKAERKAILGQITALLQDLDNLALQTALEEVVVALQGSGGRLWLPGSGQLYLSGAQPAAADLPVAQLEDCYGLQTHLAEQPSGDWGINDIYQVSSLRTVQAAFRGTAIRSWLILPLTLRSQPGYLSIFRDQVDTETLWAGYHRADARQSLPRQSFETWRQSQIGQAQTWSEYDLALGRAIAHQMVIALDQAELYRQVHALNDSLEQQVRDRTLALQQSTQQQQTLFEVVTKMRRSLNLGNYSGLKNRGLFQDLRKSRVL
jgi:light-regulated signal transduction histidine kinase (bacteriophytochrome)